MIQLSEKYLAYLTINDLESGNPELWLTEQKPDEEDKLVLWNE